EAAGVVQEIQGVRATGVFRNAEDSCRIIMLMPVGLLDVVDSNEVDDIGSVEAGDLAPEAGGEHEFSGGAGEIDGLIGVGGLVQRAAIVDRNDRVQARDVQGSAVFASHLSVVVDPRQRKATPSRKGEVRRQECIGIVIVDEAEVSVVGSQRLTGAAL